MSPANIRLQDLVLLVGMNFKPLSSILVWASVNATPERLTMTWHRDAFCVFKFGIGLGFGFGVGVRGLLEVEMKDLTAFCETWGSRSTFAPNVSLKKLYH